MSVKIIGPNIDGGLEQADSPMIVLEADGTVLITRKWKITKSTALGYAPRPKTSDPLGMNAKCVRSTIAPERGPWSIVTSEYQGYLTMPPAIYEFQNSRMDRPIQLHPKFNDTNVFPDASKVFEKIDPNLPLSSTNKVFSKFKDAGTNGSADLKFAGIESFIVGTATWTKTWFATTADFTITNVGKLSTPDAGGYSIPDSSNSGKHWIQIEHSCKNLMKGASILYELRDVWLYNSLAWLSEIYS